MDFKGVSNVLEKYGSQITESIKTRLKQDGTYATGETYNSVKHEVSGTTLEIYFNDNVDRIDKGMKPQKSFPSIQSIMKWMSAKNIKGRDPKTGKFRSQEKAARYIAKAIYFKGTIKRFGYSGTGVLDFAFGEKIQKRLLDELSVAFVKEASDELLNTLLKNGFTRK
jgi:hypothetical protein|tara:strand:+ start:25 stop:525 length:501 start_codon:yes stop_codon:yes gene_type:complete